MGRAGWGVGLQGKNQSAQGTSYKIRWIPHWVGSMPDSVPLLKEAAAGQAMKSQLLMQAGQHAGSGASITLRQASHRVTF